MLGYQIENAQFIELDVSQLKEKTHTHTSPSYPQQQTKEILRRRA